MARVESEPGRGPSAADFWALTADRSILIAFPFFRSLCGVAGACDKRCSVAPRALPAEAYCQAKIRMEVLDQACVDISMVGGLAVGLPVSAWVFPDGSPEWGVFPETCDQARKS